MQLFTIGLYELERDGTVKLDGRREPIETYDNEDVTGLARVFTGFSWAGPDQSDQRFFGNTVDLERQVRPMQPYPKFHSTAAKQFLGLTIPAQGTADPLASLKSALDHLFMHPNVPPFISKQLIQRLVVSNPSPAYVARIAAVFENNGLGVRGDLKTVVRAILIDPEARDAALNQNPSYGKVREPVLRMANLLRAFSANSASGRWLVGSTDDAAGSLGQTAMRSPSVFNFYRPGYVPPNSALGTAGLTAPELQIAHETTVAGYLNYMRSVIPSGAGSGSPRDVQLDYTSELQLATDAPRLVEHVIQTLAANQLSPAARQAIVDAVTSVAISTTNATAAETARRNRVHLAVFLVMASPEYIVQR
jgi:uncharacterized protein (DUF1800 family)